MLDAWGFFNGGALMVIPRRKPMRLRGYDYSRPGWYFVTICTKDRQCVFWDSIQTKTSNDESVQTLTTVGAVHVSRLSKCRSKQQKTK